MDNRPDRHLNFKTDILQGNLSVNIHFDNGFLLNKGKFIYPWFSFGLGYMTFDAKGDFKDKNNIAYHYWNDGTLRDQNFDWENPQNGNILKRDYKFESDLDTLKRYKHNALTIPLGLGLNFKISEHVELNVSSVYILTQTDAIDNLSYQDKTKFKLFSKQNDSYLYSYASLQINIGGISKQVFVNKSYKNIDFKPIQKDDADADGIADFNDKCPNTPVGVEVDNNGCPVDVDKDGVPDYLDKENSTPPGKLVDENGITITPEMIEAKFIRDSLLMAGVLILETDSSASTSDVNDSLLNIQNQAYINSAEINKQFEENAHFGKAVIISKSAKTLSENNKDKQITNTVTSKDIVKNKTTQTTQTTQITSSIDGIEYRVQVGSSSSSGDKPFIQKAFNIQEEIFMDVYQGAYKYSIGKFYSYTSARQYADEFRTKSGVRAFVISYQNGKRIPIADATKITGQ